MNDWSAQIKRLSEKGKHDIKQLCRTVKVEIFSGIVSDTRVGNPSAWKTPAPKGYVGGRLRGNWQIQETTKPQKEIARLDPSGAQVNAEIQAVSSGDGVTYFVNHLPYAKKWEEEDAMVGRNVARVRQIVKKLAGEIK